MINVATWKEGELKTVEYMKKLGYKILYTNFYCAHVELDIVAIYSKKLQKHNLKLKLKDKLKTLKTRAEKSIEKQIYVNKLKNVKDLLVVTEVKSRSSSKFGIGAESVTSKKQAHIKRGAEFLLKSKRFQECEVRFDVSSVDAGEVYYIENAF